MHIPDDRAGHRILVVDDDRIIRHHVMELIASSMKDIDLVAEAFDGCAALDMLDEVLPGIVLVDMRMPRVDGLGFVRAAHERYPWMQCFILSNYDEFELVKGAFKEGVTDYVLKYQIEAEDIFRLVTQGQAALKANVERMRLEAHIARTRRIAEMTQLGRAVHKQEWPGGLCVAALWCSALGSAASGAEWHNQALAAAAEAIDYKYGDVALFAIPEGAVSAMLHIGACASAAQHNNALPAVVIRDVAAALSHALDELGIVYACVVSDLPQCGSHLAQCGSHLAQLREAARWVFYLENSDTFALPAFDGFSVLSKYTTYEAHPEECAQLARGGFADAALDRLRATAAHILKYRLDPSDARRVLLRFHAALVQEGAPDEMPVFALDSLHTMMLALEEDVRMVASMAGTSYNNPNIDQAVRYILENLSKPLPLEEVASHSGYSRNHFCRIFKQVTGTSFNAFVNTARMNLAGALLRKGLSVSEVAKQVGFQDTRYFRRVFEKFMGMPTGAWREREGETE